MANAKEYLQLSLREAGKHDYENKLKDKLTGWGKVSEDRQARGVSRKAKRNSK